MTVTRVVLEDEAGVESEALDWPGAVPVVGDVIAMRRRDVRVVARTWDPYDGPGGPLLIIRCETIPKGAQR